MSFREPSARRRVREPPARRRAQRGRLLVRRERLAALGSLALVATVVLVLVVAAIPGSGPGRSAQRSVGSARRATVTTTASSSPATGQAVITSVPILVYHVINAPPPQSAANPALYVPADEFTSQMDALKAAGWHAVTLNQLQAYWTRGGSLGAGKPIVLSFDNGYASQYTNALPVLKRLGWVGVENLQLSGLPPAEGGLTDAQIRGLVAAGWELDTQGAGHADLITLDTAQLSTEIATARQTLRSRYGVPANWFSYPSGHYNATVTAAVRAAGFVGATTVNPGWASSQQDRFRLPRLPVLGGTSPSTLLSQIAAARATTTVPVAYSGPGVA
ncbi:MAG TPA: polysaccharide deacetylase family protein [Solirubrobacteraceae bacterium]|nr:polysaccharide deacetylase family protein [Solirubrobacteraceae bacterium]